MFSDSILFIKSLYVPGFLLLLKYSFSTSVLNSTLNLLSKCACLGLFFSYFLIDVKNVGNSFPTYVSAIPALDKSKGLFIFNPEINIKRGNRIVFDSDNYDVIKVNKSYDSVGIHHLEVLARLIDHD